MFSKNKVQNDIVRQWHEIFRIYENYRLWHPFDKYGLMDKIVDTNSNSVGLTKLFNRLANLLVIKLSSYGQFIDTVELEVLETLGLVCFPGCVPHSWSQCSVQMYGTNVYHTQYYYYLLWYIRSVVPLEILLSCMLKDFSWEIKELLLSHVKCVKCEDDLIS